MNEAESPKKNMLDINCVSSGSTLLIKVDSVSILQSQFDKFLEKLINNERVQYDVKLPLFVVDSFSKLFKHWLQLPELQKLVNMDIFEEIFKEMAAVFQPDKFEDMPRKCDRVSNNHRSAQLPSPPNSNLSPPISKCNGQSKDFRVHSYFKIFCHECNQEVQLVNNDPHLSYDLHIQSEEHMRIVDQLKVLCNNVRIANNGTYLSGDLRIQSEERTRYSDQSDVGSAPAANVFGISSTSIIGLQSDNQQNLQLTNSRNCESDSSSNKLGGGSNNSNAHSYFNILCTHCNEIVKITNDDPHGSYILHVQSEKHRKCFDSPDVGVVSIVNASTISSSNTASSTLVNAVPVSVNVTKTSNNKCDVLRSISSSYSNLSVTSDMKNVNLYKLPTLGDSFCQPCCKNVTNDQRMINNHLISKSHKKQIQLYVKCIELLEQNKNYVSLTNTDTFEFRCHLCVKKQIGTNCLFQHCRGKEHEANVLKLGSQK